MLELIKIEHLDIPELVPFKTLRQSMHHYEHGIFIAEGEKVARRLLESPLCIISVLLTPEWLKIYEPLLKKRSEPIKVFIASKNLLETIVGFNLHQGIMALGKIPQMPDMDATISKSHSPFLFVAIDGLTNAENLGVLIRNCTAFSVQAVLVGETSSSPYLRRAVRNSMGTVFKIAIVHCKRLVDELKKLKYSYQFSIIAAHPHSKDNLIFTTDLNNNCCIVFGSEGNGISKEVLDVCDSYSSIPMQYGVDSINVASASAVFLYEAMRQREK